MLIDYYIIDVSKENKEFRSQKMISQLHDTITGLKPDHIVFEDVALQTNISTLILLARIQGAIISSSLANKIPYSIYKPTSWRKILMFNQGREARKELKKQAINYVNTVYDLTVKEDIAESICIGVAYLTENNRPTIKQQGITD